MNVSRRKAVSPIIATLLLIAIAVAAGIIVYVFVGGLSGNLTKSGGGQVTDQVSLVAYDFTSLNSLTIYVQNTGPSAVNITAIYFNGAPATMTPQFAALSPSQQTNFVITVTGAAAGTSYPIKIVTASGSAFPFSVTAGSSG